MHKLAFYGSGKWLTSAQSASISVLLAPGVIGTHLGRRGVDEDFDAMCQAHHVGVRVYPTSARSAESWDTGSKWRTVAPAATASVQLGHMLAEAKVVVVAVDAPRKAVGNFVRRAQRTGRPIVLIDREGRFTNVGHDAGV